MTPKSWPDLSRRDFIRYSSAGFLGAMLSASPFSCRIQSGGRPNFVLFLTDDQRWDGMSCAGNPILKTPNMDRIAQEGVRFSNMFVTTSLCGPSRASYLTGLYTHNHGVRRNGMALSMKNKTFPELMKDASYETALVGKWHNTDLGRNRGFDYHFGFRGQGRYYDPTGVDENVGGVLDALGECGLEENTALIYAGDNGFFIGEHHFFDKRFMYEESIRVPLLVKYPKLTGSGLVLPDIALNVDIAPTILDLAGIPVPEETDGRSLNRLLEGKKTDWRKDFLYEYYEYPGAHAGRMNRGVRTERWKYIHYFEEPQEFELYDMQKDPQEMNNLIHNPDYQTVIEMLRKRLDELRTETHDPDL